MVTRIHFAILSFSLFLQNDLILDSIVSEIIFRNTHTHSRWSSVDEVLRQIAVVI